MVKTVVAPADVARAFAKACFSFFAIGRGRASAENL
jgi:hypothetical protein